MGATYHSWDMYRTIIAPVTRTAHVQEHRRRVAFQKPLFALPVLQLG